MDLIPKPDQVASAASNVAHKVLYGGLADLRPMPRTLIDDGPLLITSAPESSDEEYERRRPAGSKPKRFAV